MCPDQFFSFFLFRERTIVFPLTSMRRELHNPAISTGFSSTLFSHLILTISLFFICSRISSMISGVQPFFPIQTVCFKSIAVFFSSLVLICLHHRIPPSLFTTETGHNDLSFSYTYSHIFTWNKK